MPGFDGTGPMGQGPISGKGMGYCISDGYRPRRRLGLGMRRGAGLGFGRGNRFAQGYALEDRAAFLREELQAIKDELSEVEEYLAKNNKDQG